MNKSLIILTLILSFGCSKPEDAYPRIEGTRMEVHEHYIKMYSMHSNNWSDGTRKAYDRDMDNAPAK